ncbi:unnamed protein product [Durusdinium trenchii]|uniref:Uncharacterized protein n=1 Tax=Durusdinium trenchii TaxID=1381693 RepID=A0ABP0JF02_9DINO
MHPLRALRTQSKETQGRHEDSDEDLPGAGLMQRERTTSSCGTEGPHRHFCSRRSSDSSAAGDSKDATLDIATESLVTFVCYSECKQLQLDLYTVSGTSATVKSLVPRNACHHFRLVSW